MLNMKDDWPTEQKNSPIATIPQKSEKFQSILYLSFLLHLKDGTTRHSVNTTMEKTAPAETINHIRLVL